MTHYVDKTNKDLNRRALSLREYVVEDVLPDHIVQEYPKLVSFLKAYYEHEDHQNSVSRLIDELFITRDISQTDTELLKFIEDELLLGQSYFEGFPDKRAAAKYSNTLYQSKGTKFSIQQFFRTFFNADPDIIYTKEQVFKVGESQIGPDSQRFLTDDKLYQTFAILIKSGLPISTWRAVYKLFVHPAGMYLGSEVQIVADVLFDFENQRGPGELEIPTPVLQGVATIGITANNQMTALFDMRTGDSAGDVELFRASLGSQSTYPNPGGNDINDLENITLGETHRLYSSIGEYLEPNSPTLDEEDSGDTFGFDLSSTETIDQDKFTWIETPISFTDSDSTVYTNDSDNEVTLRELL